MPLQPLTRQLIEKPWGRDDLPNAFADGAKHIGEAWFAHPTLDLPLLIKWIFTSERLSIQVHPDDDRAQSLGHARGKEEWWLVTNAREGATLGIGTKRPLYSAELTEAALDGSLEQLMDWVSVQAGDWFHIPPGTVHAIGAGVELVEIQQNSDVTYRLYDYGRPRELHLVAGVAASDARPFPAAQRGYVNCAEGRHPDKLVSAHHFTIWYASQQQHKLAVDSMPAQPTWIIPLTGEIVTETGIFGRGSVLYGNAADIAGASSDCTFLAAQAGVTPVGAVPPTQT